MEKEDIKYYCEKNIKITLSGNDYQYNGYIEKLSDKYLLFKDKYNKIVLISYKDIKTIRENI